MDDALRERVEALERAVTDGEHDLSAFAADAAALERLETLEADVEDLAARVEELEAATQALRGYVGNVRSVNTEVERRADAALAKAEELEDRLSETTPQTDRRPPAPTNGHGSATAGDTPDGGDTATGADDRGRNNARGRNNDPARSDERAVDEWEWVTDDATGETGEAHADGTAGAGAGGASGTEVDSTGASDGRRCASCGRPHSSDGGQAAGAPTVAEIAESDPAGIGSDDGAPGDDGDVLPDGAEDPLIGSGDDDRPGTLQRIRDLL